MDELIGKVVHALYVTSDDEVLLFETDAGDVAYEALGEVSSETWFADIIGVPYLLGHKVTAAEYLDLRAMEQENADHDDGRTRQFSDRFYGVKLTTDLGYVDIIYRISSNGYYGGEIKPYRGESRPDDLVPITADWQA